MAENSSETVFGGVAILSSVALELFAVTFSFWQEAIAAAMIIITNNFSLYKFLLQFKTNRPGYSLKTNLTHREKNITELVMQFTRQAPHFAKPLSWVTFAAVLQADLFIVQPADCNPEFDEG